MIFVKYVGLLLIAISAILLIIGSTIQPNLVLLAFLMFCAGVILATIGWAGDSIKKERKQEKEAEELQQDYDALEHLDQELEAEIENIYAHMCESREQMKRYIDIYDKNMDSIIAGYVAEISDNTSLLTISARFRQIKEVQNRFIDEESKLGTLIDDRPDDFDFEKATHVDYQLFMEEKKLHQEKIRAQAGRFFKSYEDFKTHADAELEGKVFK